MKKISTTLTLIICGLVNSQMKIDHVELQSLKQESQKKYDRELLIFKSQKGITPEMVKNFAGYEAGIPMFYEEVDSRQAIATNTNWLYNEAIPGVNLSGLGMKVYIWDGGFMNTTHQEFQGRAFNKETNQPSSHATNVAGVIAAAGLSTQSNGNNSKGMAYEATVYGYDFYGNTISELSGEAMSPENSEYLISNNSWGQVVGWSFDNNDNIWRWYGNIDVSPDEPITFGLYGDMDANLDQLVYNSPQVIYVKSSGNNYGGGPDTAPAQHLAQSYSAPGGWVLFENVFRPKNCGLTGFDCIPVGGIAKNIITVGAVNSMTSPYSGPNSVTIASFSSVGPADDGRIKPDIVAVGTQVYTPSDGSNTAYTTTQGTSFSAPQASGNILLLQELYKEKHDEYLRADLAKAIVIHTANEAGANPGPDYVFGWGLMDMKKAAEVVLDKDNYSLTDINTLQNNSTHTFQVKAVSAQPLKVTISWLDPQATASNTHNDRAAKLVNDLDLRVTDGLITYFPWKLDVHNPSAAATKGDNVLDNTEQVVIDSPIPGQTYTITVSHKGSLTNNQQVYALVASGIEVGCKVPSDLNAYEVTNESARLKWSSSQTVFDVEFGLEGFTPTGNPTHANVSNEYLIENLTEDASYSYYVRAKCEGSENSSWAGPYSFVATSEVVYDDSVSIFWSGTNIDVNTANPCARELTIEVPLGKKIASVNVEYKISNTINHLASDFRSLIYSPTLGMGESSFASVPNNNTNFTAEYNRELPFLVNATGNIVLQLRVFDTRYDYGICDNVAAFVDAGSWKVTPVFVDGNECLAPVGINATTDSTSSFTVSWLSESNVDLVYGPSGFTFESGTLIQNISGNSYQVTNLNSNLAQYYLRSNCGGENTSDWVGPFEVDFSYCELSANVSYWEHITNVSFADLNNSTVSHSGYNDFTHLSANVQQGQTYPLSVTINPDSNDHVYAYIDWNQNFQFEENELIQIASGTSENGPHTVNVLVPEDAVPGNTRMRVVVAWNIINYLGCGSHGYGEVEDYTINVSGNEVIWTTEGAWSNVTGPTIDHHAIIEGHLNLNDDLSAKNLTVLENASLIVKSGKTLTLAGELINETISDAIIVESDANIIQTDEAVQNTGEITIVRHSDDMVRLDYSMWSSPVSGQNIQAFSPETLPNRIYTYEGDNGYEIVQNPETNNMISGKGYLYRAPNNWWENGAPMPAQPYVGIFKGIINNGDISISTHPNSFTSIGNPYPSNINLTNLFSLNSGMNTVYFWTNRFPADDQGNYTVDNYITCNSAGCTNGTLQNNIITVGQGFIVKSTDNQINFNNSIRVSNSGSFLKVESDQKHRFWLDFSEEHQPAFNQILIGYVTDGTDGFDPQLDGKSIDYEGSTLYSLIDNEDGFVIQGRALPFELSDIVPLGIRVNETKKFTIKLAQFDGLFSEGDVVIYLKDKQENIIHNLIESPYTFEAGVGIHNDRFEVIYQDEGQMGVSDLDGKNVSIYTQNEKIFVETKNEKIVSVKLYDIQGRVLHISPKVNSNQYQVTTILKGVVVVKVELANGEIITKKVIVK